MTDALTALATLRFNWAPVADDLWRPLPYHVEELHREVVHLVMRNVELAGPSGDGSPIGVVIEGQRGSGKTHLLGWLRDRVQREGGFFVLVDLLDANDFFQNVVRSTVESLSRVGEGGESQLKLFLRRLANDVGVPRDVRRAVAGEALLTRENLDAFVDTIRRHDRVVGRQCQDVLRALVLLGAEDLRAQDVGDAFFTSLDDEALTGWGVRRMQRTPQQVVRDISRLLALNGPTVIAVDQIDTLVAQSTSTTGDTAADDDAAVAVVERVAHGLMELRQVTRRTVTVLACIPLTWRLIKTHATDTVQDRFRETVQLHTIPNPRVGQRVVELRLATHYREQGFAPPYPTWPVRPEAFDESVDFTPRQLLQTVEGFIQECVAAGEVKELGRLVRVEDRTGRDTHVAPAPDSDLMRLDRRFDELISATDVATAVDPQREDTVMPDLLAAGLVAWVAEQGAGRDYTIDPRPGAKPALHARLRRTLDEETDDEIHWAFRAIAADHPVSALSRIRRACSAAGLSPDVPKRKLFLLRRWEWSPGPKTTQEIERFAAAGGRRLGFTDEDLKAMAALRAMVADNDPSLRAWLAARRPTQRIGILREALSDDSMPAPDPPPDDHVDLNGRGSAAVPARRGDADVPAPRGEADRMSLSATVPLGHALETGEPLLLELEALRKHAAIFAGSGSGKTVLVRRIVEECALQGVSSIVLDPNNDLSRLGEPWPKPPTAWGPADVDRAAAYIAGTDVIIWTPRRESGRPLSFQPLPDFRSVMDDTDELDAAIDTAVAALAPRAKVDGNTTKANLGQAVLREALRAFALRGGGRLRDLLALLADLPDDVSALRRADRIAADLSQALTAAMVNDPMFGGTGAPVDPAVLLTPPPGKRARVSVISFIGLPSDDQRQSFVNQLQMALFAWVKKHPAGERPLGGLLVMDEAQTLAPSGAMTACTQSTIALASQARKYGLGLLFATQAPKALHNRIPGNAATQFFGFLNSPTQIAAAKEMAQAKGGDVPDISRLRTGQFYVALEGTSLFKTQTPLCLSHHPKSPPTAEEVISRAKARVGPA
jgi:Helicase HerA, central domain